MARGETRVMFYSRVKAAEAKLFKPVAAVVAVGRAVQRVDRPSGPVDRMLALRRARRAIQETIGR